MAAIENIMAWAQEERARLSHQLEELQSGRLYTFEKHHHPPGWLEIDTTEQSIELCRLYISELSAIIARYPQIVPTEPAAPPPAPRFIPPVQSPGATAPALPPRRMGSDVHPDWLNGWGVIKGKPPRWAFVGIYATHAEADEAAAKAGEGYYARWGSYNTGTKEFNSGPRFAGD